MNTAAWKEVSVAHPVAFDVLVARGVRVVRVRARWLLREAAEGLAAAILAGPADERVAIDLRHVEQMASANYGVLARCMVARRVRLIQVPPLVAATLRRLELDGPISSLASARVHGGELQPT